MNAETLQILYWIEKLARSTPYRFIRSTGHDRQYDEPFLRYAIWRQQDNHKICTLDLYYSSVQINNGVEFTEEKQEYKICKSIISEMDEQLRKVKKEFSDFTSNNASKYTVEFLKNHHNVYLNKGVVYSIEDIPNATPSVYAFLNLALNPEETIPVLPRNIPISVAEFDMLIKNSAVISR